MATTQDERIINAMSNGRLVYDTGRKTKTGHNIWESLHPDSRKLVGLPPLAEVITDKQFVKRFAESGYFKGFKSSQYKRGKK